MATRFPLVGSSQVKLLLQTTHSDTDGKIQTGGSQMSACVNFVEGGVIKVMMFTTIITIDIQMLFQENIYWIFFVYADTKKIKCNVFFANAKSSFGAIFLISHSLLISHPFIEKVFNKSETTKARKNTESKHAPAPKKNKK
jgi:hypothetical protein